jgi:hypothetical protein
MLSNLNPCNFFIYLVTRFCLFRDDITKAYIVQTFFQCRQFVPLLPSLSDILDRLFLAAFNSNHTNASPQQHATLQYTLQIISSFEQVAIYQYPKALFLVMATVRHSTKLSFPYLLWQALIQTILSFMKEAKQEQDKFSQQQIQERLPLTENIGSSTLTTTTTAFNKNDLTAIAIFELNKAIRYLTSNSSSCPLNLKLKLEILKQS